MIIFKKIILIFTSIIFLGYDIIIIIKIIFSYKIKKGKITWFIRCDYAFIILNLLYFAYLIFIIYNYFKFVGKLIKDGGTKCILKAFRDFKINDYVLPENFTEMNDYKKKKYILDNKNQYIIPINIKEVILIP